MENLVIKSVRGNAVTNSLLVAEKFNKEHKHVLDSIKNLVAENSAAKYFYVTTYKNRGKEYPMYEMNRDGFSLLVMGFTGSEALKFKIEFIEAFNKMESIHRVYRFQQTKPVEIHIIYAESEGEILKALEKKWQQHNYLVDEMTKIIKENGLSNTH